MKKCPVCKAVVILAGIGALNWGLVALFNLNLVAAIFGASMIATVIYALVGIAGLLLLVALFKPCPCDNKK